MKNVYSIVSENKKEAINLLKSIENKEIDFSKYVKENGNKPLEVYPSVLVMDKYDTIEEYQVTMVRLNDGDKMEIFIEELDENIPIDYALSTTDDNVYLGIEEVYNYINENK